MAEKVSLYDKVVQISQEYLGPAGERFIRQQIITHVRVEPEKLAKKHLPELVNWTGLAFAMLTNSKQDVEDFTNRLLALSLNTNDAPD